MSAIFISHSSKDKSKAIEVKEKLTEQGHRSVFVDFDPEDGIPAGRNWEKELYTSLRKCQAVIVLCSEHSMASHWCLIEIALTRSAGKHLFPLKISPCTPTSLLSDLQITDVIENPSEGYRRLWSGLKKAGIDPSDLFDWDGSRPPYPGLSAFQEADAAIYFGRETAIQMTMEALNRLHRLGGVKLLLILGASGSGKSSLMRAGIIPRLKKEKDRWLVIEPFRPLKRPFDQLAMAFADTSATFGQNGEWKNLREISNRSLDTTRAENFIDFVDELRLATDRREATVLLAIDQFEELLGAETGPLSTLFIDFIKALVNFPSSPLLIVATLRSDFLGAFQNHEAVNDLPYEPIHLPQMTLADFTQVIEGPAKVAGIELEPGLVQMMVADTATDDALPLLAFTLGELWNKFRREDRFTLEAYRDRLGGLQGSLARAAEAVYNERSLSTSEEFHLRKAFLTLVRLDENGRFLKKPAPWMELPTAIHSLLERFVRARLLVSRKDGEERVLEVAHEALFRSWTRLVNWLSADYEFILWRQRLRNDLDEWRRNKYDRNLLLRGPVLAEANRWMSQEKNLSQPETEFIRRSARLNFFRQCLAVSSLVLISLTFVFVSWYVQNQMSIKMLMWLAQAPFGYLPEPEMVNVGAGRFTMGSSVALGADTSAEQPQHSVVVSTPFRIGKYEVTFDEYDLFAHLTGRRLPDHNNWGRGRQPVINISWHDAKAYATWLKARTGKPYRLPTEAEWEYAARAGTETRYWWGEQPPSHDQANCADCGSLWSNKQAAPVGSFRENPWGVHDTAGNVGEWVQDCLHENYRGAPTVSTPAWEGGNESCLMRVLRGGSWNNPVWFSRSASRIWFVPDYQSASIGFRLAQDID